MTIYANYLKPNTELAEYDFSKVDKIEICDGISAHCHREQKNERDQFLIGTVASIALCYFSYLAATSFISSFGLLTTAALIYIFPVTLMAFIIPGAAVVVTIKCLTASNHFRQQAELADLHKASLLGRGIRPVQV